MLTEENSLAVLTPSRGLAHSRCVEAIYRELKLWPGAHEWFWVHGEMMPDCHNHVIQSMYEHETETDRRFEWMLFLEDDIVLPKNMLGELRRRMLEQKSADDRIIGISPQTYVKRPAKSGPQSIPCTSRNSQDGYVEGTGLFCLLLLRSLMDEFLQPLFSTLNRFDTQRNHLYGVMGQDWKFLRSIRQKGFRVMAAIDLEVDHLTVESFREKDYHKTQEQWNGPHKIVSYRNWEPDLRR